MKEQHFLSPSDLKGAFNAAVLASETEWEKIGMKAILESLSRAIGALQEAGIDTHLQLGNSKFEDIWELAKKANCTKNNIFMSAAGILRIEEQEFLLAISNLEKTPASESVSATDIPVLKVYLSLMDFSARSLRHDFRGVCFDLKEDPDAMKKLQRHIINIAADNEIIRNYDVCGVFGNSKVKRLDKSPLTSKPSRS